MPYRDVSPWAKAQRQFLRRNLAQCTVATYNTCLDKAREFLGTEEPRAVKLSQMKAYEAELSRSVAQNTQKTYCVILKCFLASCHNRQAEKWQIAVLAYPKANRVFLSEPQIERLRSIAHTKGLLDELLYSLMVDNGFRIIDCYRLTIKRAEALLRQPRAMIVSKGRYGGKERAITLHRRTHLLLTSYLAWRSSLRLPGSAGDWLLLSPTVPHLHLSRRSISAHIERLSAQAGTYFRCHDLRATFGHRHYLNGTPLETIAQMLGHESVNLTFRVYIGVTADLVRTAQDRLL